MVLTSALPNVFCGKPGCQSDFRAVPRRPKSRGGELWCHGSTMAAMLTVMRGDLGSNPGVNHGCMC